MTIIKYHSDILSFISGFISLFLYTTEWFVSWDQRQKQMAWESQISLMYQQVLINADAGLM